MGSFTILQDCILFVMTGDIPAIAVVLCKYNLGNVGSNCIDVKRRLPTKSVYVFLWW